MRRFPNDSSMRQLWKQLVRKAKEPAAPRGEEPALVAKATSPWKVAIRSPEKPTFRIEDEACKEKAVKRVLFSSPNKIIELNRKAQELAAGQEEPDLLAKGTSPWKVAIKSPEEPSHRMEDDTFAETFAPLEDPTFGGEGEERIARGQGGNGSATSTCCSDAKSDLLVAQAENYLLKLEIEELEKKCEELGKKPFSFHDIKDKPSKVAHYTGLPDAECFYLLLSMVEEAIKEGGELKYQKGWKVVNISNEDQLFILLIKLRRNLSFEDLGDRFKVSDTTISNVVLTWLHAVHAVLFEQFINEMPSRQKNATSLPACFGKFANCKVVLDCTEIYADVPKLLSNHCKLFSSYKHRVTFKGLVGIAPNGTVTYVSKLYPGSTSDKKIVNHCGVLAQLKPGDLVLADKGFLIANDLPHGVFLNIPPFLTNPQFTEEEVLLANDIARARIRVERAIERTKRYQILNFIDRHLFSYATAIFQTCAALTNLMPPLIRDSEEE